MVILLDYQNFSGIERDADIFTVDKNGTHSTTPKKLTRPAKFKT